VERTEANRRMSHEARGASVAVAVSGPPHEEPVESLMGWLALYLPSWGTSVVLHAAVFLLAAFLATQTQVIHEPFIYTTRPVELPKYKVQERQATAQAQEQKDRQSRGAYKLQPSSLTYLIMDTMARDIARNSLDEVAVIGVGGGGRDLGSIGRGTGPGGPDSGIFTQVPRGVEAGRIVYLVDRSGSMTDAFDYVKLELKRSIRELPPHKQFDVIFYAAGPALEMPARRLVSATQASKQRAFEFIDEVVPQGETDPTEGLQRAFAVGPDLIYLLTDGEFDKGVVGQVKALNVGGKVTVNTIGFLYRGPEEVLKRIAAENHGQYKFVSEGDLATLGD